MQLAVRDIVLTHKVRAAAGSYWNIAWQALLDDGMDAGRLPGHAGDFETSLMLSLRPELVSEDLPERDLEKQNVQRPGYRDERHGFWESINGHTDSPALASIDKGDRFRIAITEAVAKAWVDYARS